MKKINLTLFITLMVYSFSSYSQENILPTTGKVGIGTLNPSAKLDVNGKMHVDSAIWLKGEVKMSGVQEVENQPAAGGGNGNGNGNNNNGGNANPQQYKYLVIGEDGVVKRGKEIIIGPPGTPTGPGDTDDTPCNNINASKWDKALNKLFVNCPNVNVGINTNNPRVKLDVIGTTYSQKLALGSINPVSIGNTNLYVKSAFSAASNNKIAVFENTVGEVLTLKTNGDLETKRIIANGDVDVFGNQTINGVFNITYESQLPNQTVFSLKSNDNNSVLNINKNGNFAFNTNYVENVNYNFVSNKPFTFNIDNLSDVDYAKTFFIKVNRNNNEVIHVKNNYSNKSTFLVSGDGSTRIGDINLNTIHTDAMLTVNGKIVSKSVNCTIHNWPDYVFDENYELPTLDSIEKFYKKNKHLPEIPSEKEVMENGVDLGEMNKLLLKKIEELTLYLIKQNKKIEEFENFLLTKD
jgi:hypothetical protein